MKTIEQLSQYLNTHKPHDYTRILGERPITGQVKSEHHVDAQTLLGAFGPPESKTQKGSTLIFWNFTRKDGGDVFTLSARVNDWKKTVAARRSIWLAGCNTRRATAKVGALDFHLWVNDQVGAIKNGVAR